MGLQKYRADIAGRQTDGATAHYAKWLGGPTLAKIANCRTNMAGDPRVTAYVVGEPDSYFSTPAKARYMGKTVTGYITSDDEGLMFQHCYY